MITLNKALIGTLSVAVIGMAVALWAIWPSDKTEVGDKEATQLPPASSGSIIPWHDGKPVVPDGTVKGPAKVPVITKPPKKLGLPKLPETEKLIATARLDADEATYNVSATMDMSTGDSRVFAIREPDPWLARSKHGAVGVYYGVKKNLDDRVARGYIRQDVFRSKSCFFGGTVMLDSDGERFAGLGGECRW